MICKKMMDFMALQELRVTLCRVHYMTTPVLATALYRVLHAQKNFEYLNLDFPLNYGLFIVIPMFLL